MSVRPWIPALLTACGASQAGPAEEPPAVAAPREPVAAATPVAAPAAETPPAPAAAPEAAPKPAPEPRKTDDTLAGVIDQPAKPFEVSQWFNSAPLTLEQLRGKVVFVRWFMGPSCPFCSATAPTLRALHERYAARGLAVVGMYHHKEQTPLDPKQVQGWIKHFGYEFPVAIDKDWATLRRWWLDGHERSYTSVSFLIDKAGVVRRVHLGGTIAPEGGDIDAIRADVERLLAK
jgi:thiol-disulfide isomerase/thioredoxin